MSTKSNLKIARMRLELFANRLQIRQLQRINRGVKRRLLRLESGDILADRPTAAEYVEERAALAAYEKTLDTDWETAAQRWCDAEYKNARAEWSEARATRDRGESSTIGRMEALANQLADNLVSNQIKEN